MNNFISLMLIPHYTILRLISGDGAYIYNVKYSVQLDNLQNQTNMYYLIVNDLNIVTQQASFKHCKKKLKQITRY